MNLSLDVIGIGHVTSDIICPFEQWPEVDTKTVLPGLTLAGGGPAVGATVRNDKGRTATTGADGSYSIPYVGPRTYSLTVELTGYQSQTVSAVVTAGGTTTVDYTLSVVAPGSVSGTVTVLAGEVVVAQEILQTMGLRAFTPMVTACPGCGRTTTSPRRRSCCGS